jgi:hypothetical protein
VNRRSSILGSRSEGHLMTLLEHMGVGRRLQIFDDGDRMKAAMESLVENEDPSFKIVMILIGLVMLYALGLPLNYA